MNTVQLHCSLCTDLGNSSTESRSIVLIELYCVLDVFHRKTFSFFDQHNAYNELHAHGVPKVVPKLS